MSVAEKTLRIVIVDDHPVIREGIRKCLKEWSDLKIVAEAKNGEEGVAEVAATHPDVVLLDLTMPRVGGLEALPSIRRVEPAARVIVLTVHNTREYVRQAMAAKVDGFLLKDTAPQEYVEAIRTVMRGEFFISPSVASYARAELPSKVAARFGLTESELQYVSLTARGQRPAQIAEILQVTEPSVRMLRRSVFKKLKFRNMSMLTRFALEQGL